MRLIKTNKLYIGKENNDGFAIPQVLILGVGIAVAVTGLMAASILGLTGSRISRQELIAKASSYSGVTTIRSLLNDGSENGFFHYFWLIDTCSDNSRECTQTSNIFSNPSKEYWPDDEWCQGSDNCYGRQKAPMCGPSQGWEDILNTFNILLDKEPDSVGDNLETPTRDIEQAYKLISTKYTGTDQYGLNSILIEGMAIAKNSDLSTASNKLRVNIQVQSETTEAGFGFLSIGENNSDQEGSLFLGNLTITPMNSSKGSIIWRRNLDENECEDFQIQAQGEESTLPTPGNGGIWVQPLGLPKQPRLSNVEDLGILICTANVIQQNPAKCTLDSINTEEKVYRIHSLYAKGPGAKFEISTTEDSKIILEIMGDIDISDGGIFCHKNGISPCGTGKAENLTILFKQKTTINGNKVACNREDNTGGVKLTQTVDFSDLEYPFDNNQLPGSSFLIDNTGDNYSDQFGAFIYGPKVTFLSIRRPESESGNHWVQITNSETYNSGLIVTSRASYSLIGNTMSESIQDRMVNIILTPSSHIIPYLNNSELPGESEKEPTKIEVIGVGYKVNDLPNGSQLNPNANKALIIYDKENAKDPYYLRTFEITNINSASQTSSEFSYPLAFAKMNSQSNSTHVGFGKEGLESEKAKSYLHSFGINMQSIEAINSIPIRNFSGAAWVKNLCFDLDGDKTWEFSKDFINGLIEWHGKEFNWGVRYYRGRSITLWDTLRNFND